jgi:4-hydroxy-tetrahydrodipicolinate synthase
MRGDAIMVNRLHSMAGSAVAIPTPFKDDRIDTMALARLCDRQVERGSSAIIVCGSTGEASALSALEQARVVAVAVEAVSGRVPVIAGCTASATAASVILAAGAARAGADGLLCAPPPYTRPTQDGIIAHIQAVAGAAPLPIVAYDVPSRCAVSIADTTIATLFERQLIVALKDATADLSRPARLQALCGAGLLQMSGDDATAAAYLAMGGDGCISVTANVTPMLCSQMHRAWNEGALAQFASLRDWLNPLHPALFAESNPIPLKAALDQLGLCSGALRLPLTPAAESTQQRLSRVLAELMPREERASQRPRLVLVS